MGDVHVYPIWVYLLFFAAMAAGVAISLVGLFTNTFLQSHRQDWTQRLKKGPTTEWNGAMNSDLAGPGSGAIPLSHSDQSPHTTRGTPHG